MCTRGRGADWVEVNYHLLKLRPRSRFFSSYSIIAKRGGQREGSGGGPWAAAVWRRRRNADSVTLIVCRGGRPRDSHRGRYDRPTLRRYNVIGKDLEC